MSEQPTALPETMLQPVSFDDSADEVKRIRMVPVDETEDEW